MYRDGTVHLFASRTKEFFEGLRVWCRSAYVLSLDSTIIELALRIN